MDHSVAAIVFNRERNEVLCVKRRDVSIWVLPGGLVDENESLEKAVLREVEEETGLKIGVKRKVGEYTPIQVIKTVTHVYECFPVSGQMTCTDEVRDVGFYPINQLPQLFFMLHEHWIQDALSDKPGIIKRDLTELTYRAIFRFALKHPIHVFRFFLSKWLGIPINS